MKYFVRVYCHTSYELGACSCVPPHPFVLDETFDSIRAANDRGDVLVGIGRDDEREWEVIDERENVVC